MRLLGVICSFGLVACVISVPILQIRHTSGISGPSRDDIAKAQQIVATMMPEQKAGRVLMSRVNGTDAATAYQLVQELNLGGVILFANNVVNTQQVQQMTSGLAQMTANMSSPLLISVDQEGGLVARIRTGATEFPTYMTHGSANNGTMTTIAMQASGQELRALGFNHLSSPDSDVTIGPNDPTIGSRSASSDPRLVSAVVRSALVGYEAAGMIPTIKHFPGHGSLTQNSHDTLPVQTQTLNQLRARDLIPFKDAAAAGAPCVMVGHMLAPAIDPVYPTSISKKTIDLLRGEIGFKGVSMTDALEMAAIQQEYGDANATLTALLAGQDILLMPVDIRGAHAAIVSAVANGTVPQQRLDEAATRVAALALWQQRIAGPTPPMSDVNDAAHHQASYQASLDGLAVVTGPCSGSLISNSSAIQVVGGGSQDRSRLTTAAQGRGLTVGTTGPVINLNGSTPAVDVTGGGGARKRQTSTSDVMVALDVPYNLENYTAPVKIALFGATPDAFNALVDVLTGSAISGGHVPVNITVGDRNGC